MERLGRLGVYLLVACVLAAGVLHAIDRLAYHNLNAAPAALLAATDAGWIHRNGRGLRVAFETRVGGNVAAPEDEDVTAGRDRR